MDTLVFLNETALDVIKCYNWSEQQAIKQAAFNVSVRLGLILLIVGAMIGFISGYYYRKRTAEPEEED